MATAAQAASQIRFALSQLPAHNAHHVFEDICRHLTTQFICSNVLPATGPVSAGGDQGRDFETFRSYLRNELGPHGGFLGLVSDGTIAFVCTTQAEDIAAKVAHDIEKICASGHPVHEVKAFSLASLPVAARHKLESETQQNHEIRLEFFDAEAIADLLARPQGFWIAEQFLALPAELGPPQPPNDDNLSAKYVELRIRWRAKRTPDPTLGDLVDIKTGLREATFREDARADLPFWIGLVRQMLADATLPDLIRQRARYELVVATLRGLGNLKPVDEVARAYMNESLTESEPARLQDANVLLLYAGGAVKRGVTTIAVHEHSYWHGRLKMQIERALVGATPHRRASLLFTLGCLGSHPLLTEEDVPEAPEEMPDLSDWDWNSPPVTVPIGTVLPDDVFVDAQLAMSAWTELADGLEATPLFPVDLLSGHLQFLTPLLVDQPGWRVLVDLVDKAVDRVSGKNAVAERARDRSMMLLRAERRLEALEEFHQAKIDWWSGDTIRGSLLAMLMIARLYLELRLPMAAKAHGLAVAFAAATSADEELADLVPAGLLMAAQADFASGAWCSATEMFEQGLVAQHYLVEDGLNLEEHEAVQAAVLHLTYISACARDVDPALAATVGAAASRAGVKEIVDGVLDISQLPKESSWDSFGSDDLTAPPFSDLGKTRFMRFSALGTDWTLESANDSQSVRAAERLAAAAQALLAALAGEDLCIMPTRVTVLIEIRSPLTRHAGRVIEALPSNDGRLWKVHLAPITDSKVLRLDEIISDLLAVLTQILFEASLLPEADFMVIIERASQRGIGHKLSPARPYDELAAEFSDERCTEMQRDRLVPPWDLLGGPYTAHADLAWQQGPGPTFSSDKAKKVLQTRYANLASSLRKHASGADELRRRFAALSSHSVARGGWTGTY